MKELKSRPTLYANMQRLVNNLSDDDTRRNLQGIYQDKFLALSTTGATLYATNCVPSFYNVEYKRIIDIKPVAKTFTIDMFKTYTATIDREYPRVDFLLTKDFSKMKHIKITFTNSMIELFSKLKSKNMTRLYFDGETFTLSETEKTLFAIDASYLGKLFPLEMSSQKITVFYTFQEDSKIVSPIYFSNKSDLTITKIDDRISLNGDDCDTWVYVIMPLNN